MGISKMERSELREAPSVLSDNGLHVLMRRVMSLCRDAHDLGAEHTAVT